MLIGILIFSSHTLMDYAPILKATGPVDHPLPYRQLMEKEQKGINMCCTLLLFRPCAQCSACLMNSLTHFIDFTVPIISRPYAGHWGIERWTGQTQ